MKALAPAKVSFGGRPKVGNAEMARSLANLKKAAESIFGAASLWPYKGFGALLASLARLAKADGHVVKPFETQVLIDKVADLLRRRSGSTNASTLLAIPGLIAHIPRPLLAAVILVTVARLLSIAPLREARRSSRDDGLAGTVSFVATLAFGEGWQTQTLRHFRDAVLRRRGWGRSIVYHYYRAGPGICAVLEASPALLGCMRWLLGQAARLWRWWSRGAGR